MQGRVRVAFPFSKVWRKEGRVRLKRQGEDVERTSAERTTERRQEKKTRVKRERKF